MLVCGRMKCLKAFSILFLSFKAKCTGIFRLCKALLAPCSVRRQNQSDSFTQIAWSREITLCANTGNATRRYFGHRGRPSVTAANVATRKHCLSRGSALLCPLCQFYTPSSLFEKTSELLTTLRWQQSLCTEVFVKSWIPVKVRSPAVLWEVAGCKKHMLISTYYLDYETIERLLNSCPET